MFVCTCFCKLLVRLRSPSLQLCHFIETYRMRWQKRKALALCPGKFLLQQWQSWWKKYRIGAHYKLSPPFIYTNWYKWIASASRQFWPRVTCTSSPSITVSLCATLLFWHTASSASHSSPYAFLWIYTYTSMLFIPTIKLLYNCKSYLERRSCSDIIHFMSESLWWCNILGITKIHGLWPTWGCSNGS